MAKNVKKRIMIIIPPASGHINPVTCIVNKLNSKNDFDILFFGTEKFKNVIMKSGAKYKAYSKFDMDDERIVTKAGKKSSPFEFFSYLMEVSESLLPELKIACNNFKPNLIMHDNLSIPAKYLMNYLEIESKNKRLNYPLPKELNIFSSFALIDGIYPNKEEKKITTGNPNIADIKSLMKLVLKQKNINKKNGLNIKFSPITMVGDCEQLNICTVIHELQPRADNMVHKVRFTGCCIQEDVRYIEVTNERLKQIMEEFKPINPISLADVNNNKGYSRRLLYASLGSVVNKNIIVYEKIIDSFRNPKLRDHINSSNLEVVISLGVETFKVFEEKMSKENYKVPDNILLLPSVPQLEILKRASLFITHAGMNSTSEAIHYGVPVICLPVQADQPLVALRICDELNFGKRLDYLKFTSDELRKCAQEILENKEFHRNILEFTEISRKYNGISKSAEIITNYINRYN